ncbi:MAG: tRNA (adenosine(37)-N6)-threonylcarbamoyltransferase complex dimerization subunit type 1 TsaB [Ardenticatenaceae bacterium]|nr:tRNA (adenosine(37)-N6)-threonylcarbamoyltransferase complex dimerization subunit type 1 TsaB [Ardenticatenaceae bacterium]MCB8989735.1 tRNA (adenosine(37)-N6)-threonylcarbamoyltransferase complex dimerization subunit type 1 TsaB [Ardenticatenaceae bacterium]MCB9002806.1 tRNA (adenosine(37)-N6)-threonylcarbamoyltransferase complex dimerization subunit type 1 TsaB [Ardenticatenaceae bacterium]
MILAIDTATRWTGLALHDGTAVIDEAGWHSINTQTIELSPSIERMLVRQGLTGSDLKAIAVALGPGSYTGLRVGLGVAKGMALAHQTPIIGVPTLDILAHSIGERSGQLVVIAEAGRSRVCAGVYQWHGRRGWQSGERPVIVNWDELLASLNTDDPHTFAGEISAEAAKTIRAASKEFQVALPSRSTRRAGCLAEIAWVRLRKGQTDNARTLAPIYLKDPAGN